MTTRKMIDLVADDVIVERDYMPLPSESISEENWKMDCADFLLNLSDDDLVVLRKSLARVRYYEQYMLHKRPNHAVLGASGLMLTFSADVVALLLKSLDASNVTQEMLEVDK